MSRPLRIEYPEAWYHVMNRGRRWEDIFLDKDDYRLFLENLEYAAGLFHVKITAWCLMSNHYHLLVNTPEANLSRFMQHVDGVYTQKFNRAHRLDGQLFRGRYKSIIVDPDGPRYFMAVVAYIHLNPEKAGLEPVPGVYPWSSWEAYTKQHTKQKWVFTKPVLDRFSGTEAEKRLAFHTFVLSQSSSILDEIFERDDQPLAWGDKPFVKWLKKTFLKEKRHHQVPMSRELAPSVDDILEAVLQVYDITPSSLFTSRRGVFNEPRNVAMYLIRHLRADTLLSIGNHFGLTRYSSVNSVISRIQALSDDNADLNHRLEAILSLLNKSQEET